MAESGALKRKHGPKLLVTCDCGCGAMFHRYRNKLSPSNYYNRKHAGVAETNRYLTEMCGTFVALMKEYLDGPCRQRYRDIRSIRSHICPFFQYLRESGIPSISEVTHDTITAFQLWGRASGYKSAATDTSYLSTFFEWLIFEERYNAECPVVARFHGKKNKSHVGRPYTDPELAVISLFWKTVGIIACVRSLSLVANQE